MTRSTVLGGTCRMEGAEDEMARGGRLDSQADRFEIPHFADEDDIRVFTQRAAEGRGEGLCVDPDFAMVHDAALALVDEFDGVFNRDDMVFAGAVGLVDDGGERCRFTAARRSGDEDKPPGQ